MGRISHIWKERREFSYVKNPYDFFIYEKYAPRNLVLNFPYMKDIPHDLFSAPRWQILLPEYSPRNIFDYFSDKDNTPHEIFLFIFEFSACWCLIDTGPEKYHFERSRESHGMVPWWHGMVPWPWYGTVVPWCGIMVPWNNTMKPWCHETTILPACRNVFFTWFKRPSNLRSR